MPISRRTFLASSAATAGLLAGGGAIRARHDCRIFGVGGGGLRSLDVIEPLVRGLAEVTAVSTDRLDLERSNIPRQVQLAPELTAGLGAGSNPDVGREAALMEAERMRRLMVGADSVVLVGGLGGGTATGAMPVFAELSASVAVRTISVATVPFYFEGKRRREQTTEGLYGLSRAAGLFVPVPLQGLVPSAHGRLGMKRAFGRADQVVARVVDAARVLALLAERGVLDEPSGRGGAGFGMAPEPRRAVEGALRSPLLAFGPAYPRQVLVHLSGPAPSDRDAREIEARVAGSVGVEQVALAFSPGEVPESVATLLAFGES